MKRHSSGHRKISDDAQYHTGNTKVRSTGALLVVIIILVILLILTTVISFVLISKSENTTAKKSETRSESLQQVSGQYNRVRTQRNLSVPAFPE